MDPFHFACPHCSSRLRVREKLYVGRQVDCPECGQFLLIVEQSGELGVRAVERQPAPAATGAPDKASGKHKPSGQLAQSDVPASAGKTFPATSDTAGTAVPSPAKLAPGTSTPGAGPLISPAAGGPQHPVSSRRRATILAGGALILALGLIAVAFFARSSGTNSAADGLPDNAAVDSADPTVKDGPGNGPIDAANPEPVEPPRDEVESRLEKIGQLLQDHLAAEQTFPSGTVPILGIVPENRLSWMAVLADRFDGATVHPVWDKPWNSPQNEAFVRRRLTIFQNPTIAQLTGTDGYPASHFVGVTGVGADAARLDNRHARAGIFAEDRRTRIDDIRDGASNTLLVLGVRDHLGSWAAGGQPTMRGLAREPYVNGPDGFGTGSPESMQVLMADGRVMSVSDKIDPRIFRRMAAKADGLPLDESVEGEPGDRLSLLAGEGAADAFDQDDEEGGKIESARDKRPLDPEFAPEPPEPVAKKIDLAVSLKQSIVRFDQPKSRPLSEVLTSVAEMAGAQIDFDRDKLGPAAARLAEPVALRLDNTTVGDILTGLLRPAGLAYRVEGDHLKLVPTGGE
jgi:DNA-directed RNA polymerase subunit RPC12/RpoP